MNIKKKKQITIIPEIKILHGQIDVQYFTLFWEHGNCVSAYIPGFDIAFSSPTKERAEVKSKAMINTFFDYWITKKGFKNFILEIHRLGFRSKFDDFTIKELLNRRTSNAKFKMPKEALGLGRLQKGYVTENQSQSIAI